MFTFSTELILLMLSYARDAFPTYRVGFTKSNKDFPKASTVIFIKQDDKPSVYIFFNTRFSNSQREFVYIGFHVYTYTNKPTSSISTEVYSSIEDPSLIYDARAKQTIKAEMQDAIEAIRKELS